MRFTTYPSQDVLSQEAHETIAKERASGMFQSLLPLIRNAVKREQQALDNFAERNLSFTRMVTDLRGEEAKADAVRQVERNAKLLIN